MICKFCNKETIGEYGVHICLSPKEYRKLILDLKDKLKKCAEANVYYVKQSARTAEALHKAQDKLHKRNVQIKRLKTGLEALHRLNQLNNR